MESASDRQPESKRGPFTYCAFHPNLSAVSFNGQFAKGQAQPKPRPSPRPSKILENWKTLIKFENYWKLLEIIRKLNVFPILLIKHIGKPIVFQHFPSTMMACPDPGQTQTVQIGFQTPAESFLAHLNPSWTTKSIMDN